MDLVDLADRVAASHGTTRSTSVMSVLKPPVIVSRTRLMFRWLRRTARRILEQLLLLGRDCRSR